MMVNIKKIIQEEVDDFEWADGVTPNPIQYEFDVNPDIEYVGINKIMVTREDVVEMTEILKKFGYDWYNGMPKRFYPEDILWINDNGYIKRGPMDSTVSDKDVILDYPFGGVDINESDDLQWMRDISPSNPIETIFDTNPDIEYVGINKSMDTHEDVAEMTEILKKFGYDWNKSIPTEYIGYDNILWVCRERKILIGPFDEDGSSIEDMVIEFPFENDYIIESDDLQWIDEMPKMEDINKTGTVMVYLSEHYTVEDKHTFVRALTLLGFDTEDYFNDFYEWENMYTIHIRDGVVTGWDDCSTHDEHEKAYIEMGMLDRFEIKYSNVQIIYL